MADDDAPKPQLEADTSTVTQETGNPPVREEENPSTEATPEPAPATTTSLAQEESEPAPATTVSPANEESEPAPATTTSLAQEESEPAPATASSAQEESELASATTASPAQEESEPAPATASLAQEESELASATTASPAQEESKPAPATASPAQEESAPAPTTPAQEESDRAPVVTERATETSPLAAQDESEASSETTSELGQVAKQLVPHILNLYNSCATATDFDAVYAPNAVFEDPLMQAHGVGQIKSAFYAMPKVFLDSTVLKYSVEEEQTAPKSGEIRLHNLQQYKLLQLGPVGYYVTMQSLIKLEVEGGKVVRHEDLWGGYRLWNKHTVRVPLVGRMAETLRKGNMLLTHVLMGFGKDHKTLDKPRDATSMRLMVNT